MSESRVVPFPETQAFSRTGLGAVGGTSVQVDTGDLAVEAGVDDQGNPVVRVTAPAVHTHDDDEEFGANLADRLPENVVHLIVDEVLQGVEADEQTRYELVSQYRSGLDLIGTKLEEVGATMGQKRNISRMNDPLLLEAMVKYHPLALDTPVPTPDGWTTIGEIAVGDYVLDEWGKPVRVVGLSDIRTDKPCLKVTFDDGFSIVADADHLWTVEENSGRTMVGTKWLKRDVQTRELRSRAHFIWLSKSFELPERELPIDPYVFGLWLGDGNRHKDQITVGFADYQETVANLLACHITYHDVQNNGHSAQIAIEGLWAGLKTTKMLGDKYIPVEYMRASRAQREALLQGLMDSDGHINNITRQCTFANADFELIIQVQELLKTLSIKSSLLCCPSMTKTFPGGREYTTGHSYQLRFTVDCDRQIFRLPRKRKVQEAPHPTHARRTKRFKVVDVREVAPVPVRCLAVDSESHLFLAGLGMVPTHNSGAVAEMLPATGPAKVATEGLTSAEDEQAAQDFSDIFNYYLTEIATEFYPDHSSMLMHQAYSGNAYKKIFRCSMRNRPVSETVRMLDLIVSEEAVSLQNALRVTHQFFPSRAELKRMMILGKYVERPIPYGLSQQPIGRTAIKHTEGLGPQSTRPQDVPIQLYECDLDLDPLEFDFSGVFEREAPEGMPLPYKVTVQKDSRLGLGIWRNWEDGDELYQKDNMYVRYGLVPGLGFHNWGFLQLLGNQTRTLRAITRLLIDSGMFAIFPGGVKIKGARTSTSEIAPGPGEWVDIDVPGATDIRQVLMPLPYKQLDAVFVQFAQAVREQASKLGGTVEVEVGEGRTNAPVGTVMSQIEQSTQIMAAVHKGNHRSQKEELMKLRKQFAKNPEDLWRLNPNPAKRYETAAEFMNLNLLPASDPNIPAQIHRIMQITALLTIVQNSPGLWDMQEVLRRALQVLRVSNPEQLLIKPEQAAAMANQQPPQDPAKMAAASAKMAGIQAQHEARMQEMQYDQQNKGQDMQTRAHAAQQESVDRAADRQAQLTEAGMKVEQQREAAHLDVLKSQGQQEDPNVRIAEAHIKAGTDHSARLQEAQIRAQTDLQGRIAQAQIKAAVDHEKVEAQKQAASQRAQQAGPAGLGAGAPAEPPPEEGGTAINAPI